MNIALLGYGKMGKEIEKIAKDRGHTISLIIDIDNQNDFNKKKFENIDVAIDFSIPDTAVSNILKCFEYNVPIVSGTTGWMDRFDEVKKSCQDQNQTFFYASNYSVGVNIFFHINDYLARVMNKFSEYNVSIEEVHHTQKLDAPSGTAITLAEGLINNLDRKNEWKLDHTDKIDQIKISAKREDPVPGIHTTNYDSDVDFIEIKHSAKSRKGFASGAVIAAEFIANKKGIYTMRDLLDF